MKIVRAPALMLMLLCLGFWYYLVQSTAGLPLRVAVLFAANGRATGWVTRSDHLLLMGTIGIGLPIVLAFVGAVICLVSFVRANRPHPEDERPSVECLPSGAYVFRYLIWLACWVVCFAAALQFFIAQANSSLPANLSVGSLLAIAVSFCAVVVVWCSKLAAALRSLRERGFLP